MTMREPVDPTVLTVASVLDEHPDRPFAADVRITSADAVEAGRKWCAEQVEWEFRDATATHPAVREWVTAAVRAAVVDGDRPVAGIQPGRGLVLLGPVGTGKTWQAIGAARAIAVSGVHARIVCTSAADMYAKLRPRPGVDSEEVFERYATAGLLVLDDLGAAKDSAWVEEIDFRLIDTRYRNGRPTIITSNFTVKEFPPRVGQRVDSRLERMCQRVAIKGSDRRKGAA